jgi:prepilin-type N-terminal cleavage/methylation domain-containing protein
MRVRSSSTKATERGNGFTLIEMMVVMATLVVLCGSMVMCNLYGLSMAVRQQIWLSANDDAAQVLGHLMTDIRSGASNYVGSYSGSGGLTGWTNAGTNVWQQGNALKILMANTNGATNGAWIIYYYDPPSSNLYRTNWTGTTAGDFKQVSANMITTNNTYNYLFSAYQVVNGVWVPQTNGSGTSLIQVCLSFSKLQNPQIVIGPGNLVDFYQTITTIASRNRP